MVPLIDFHQWLVQPPPSCTSLQKSWLTRPGALTSGLKQLGRFSLQVVSEDVELAPEEDIAFLGRGLLWRREVLMFIDGQPCVIARSVTPLRASHSQWKGIRQLGCKPLAEILYHDPGIYRSAFETARIGKGHKLHKSILRANMRDFARYSPLARRSVFWRMSEPLMVSECFLDPFWKMLD